MYLVCCIRVQSRGGLVQEEHARVCDERDAYVGTFCLHSIRHIHEADCLHM